ncbi:hypothetical protein Tco_0822597 [Tanacetum coccineum]|uniref:Reverse transcriptase domain-containing protein n=1 Tax=Tanacetum coccineum TaxID=301880 RepID=A0ABQ5AJT5_9ASTR
MLLEISLYYPISNVTIPRRQNKGRAPNIVEPELRTIVAPMAEHTMEELLRAPTEGYREAIVLPEINADHFEIKTNLLQLECTTAVIEAYDVSIFARGSPLKLELFQNQASTLGTLPSNTIPNPKGEMKAITTRSGVAYEGPSIPTNPSPKKVVERETGENSRIKRKQLPRKYRLKIHSRSLVNKLRNQMDKIFPNLQDLRFDISFADALLLMPRFAPMIKSLLMNKEKFFELDKITVETRIARDDPQKASRKAWRSRQKKLSLPDLTPTRMTLELADRSITYPKRFAEDVFVKVGKFLTVRRAPELLGFFNSLSGNPTPTSEPFTSEFILEEIKAYLKDDSISPEIDYADCDPEEDICLIEKLLNNDPFQLPPIDLKQSEVTEAKSSIEEPTELELKDLPSHLEYAFLEKTDKLLVIIEKSFKKMMKRDALLKVLKISYTVSCPIAFGKLPDNQG